MAAVIKGHIEMAKDSKRKPYPRKMVNIDPASERKLKALFAKRAFPAGIRAFGSQVNYALEKGIESMTSEVESNDELLL